MLKKDGTRYNEIYLKYYLLASDEQKEKRKKKLKEYRIKFLDKNKEYNKNYKKQKMIEDINYFRSKNRKYAKTHYEKNKDEIRIKKKEYMKKRKLILQEIGTMEIKITNARLEKLKNGEIVSYKENGKTITMKLSIDIVLTTITNEKNTLNKQIKLEKFKKDGKSLYYSLV